MPERKEWYSAAGVGLTPADRACLAGRLKTERHVEKRRAQQQRAAAAAAQAQVELMRKEAAAGKDALRAAREHWVVQHLATAEPALCAHRRLCLRFLPHHQCSRSITN